MKKKTTSIITTFTFAVIVVALVVTTFAYAHTAPVVSSVQLTATLQPTPYPPPDCENHVPYPPPSPAPDLYQCDYFPLMVKIRQFMDGIFSER